MTLPSWLVPTGAVVAILGIGAGWFYSAGKSAEQRAEIQQTVARDESTIKALNVALDSAEKKERGDSTKYAADSGDYAGLETRLRAAEARYATHLAQDSADNATDAQAPDTASHGAVAQGPPLPPSPALIDSTLDAADAAQKSCSVLVLDCKAQLAIVKKELAATQDERDAFKQTQPTWLQRQEAPVCSAIGVAGIVGGIILGRKL